MNQNQDDIKKEIYSQEREYLPGTTVAQVKVEVSLHRAYIDLKTKKKIFEVLDMHSERFDARVRSDDSYEAREITRGLIEKSCESWEILPSNLVEQQEASNESE